MKVLIIDRNDDGIKNYRAALEALGVEYHAGIEDFDINEYDRLLIPGGVDINPSYYGEENKGSVEIDDELDAAQWKAIEKFVNAKKPIFGICRGCQILNAFFGGTLIQDIETKKDHTKDGENERFHSVKNHDWSVVSKLYGENVNINTSHHQACDRPGKGIRYTSMAPDGIIEGIEHEFLPVIGVQWHPERTGFAFKKDGIADGEKIFRYFISM